MKVPYRMRAAPASTAAQVRSSAMKRPMKTVSAVVQTLSELGVILLMFSLGLEFSIRKLAQVGPTAGLTAVLQSSIMVWLGYGVGQLFGRTTLESPFTGAVIAISSPPLLDNTLGEQGGTGRRREGVVGS